MSACPEPVEGALRFSTIYCLLLYFLAKRHPPPPLNGVTTYLTK